MGKPKKKTRNPGVGVDFKRVKHKVGKKLPKAKNETDTDFKSRSINLPSQAVREDRSGIAVNYQNLTLKELLNQTSHHNDKSRKHSLAGLADLFGRHPEQLRLHAAQVLGTLSERVVDGDSGVRAALRGLLGDSVLPLLGPVALRPFMPVVMAHVCGAMTHLSLDVRNDALLFLDVMMDHAPGLVVDGYLAACLAHFCDLFSAAHRGRSIRAQSLAALSKLLTALTSFLRRAFPEPDQTDAARPGGKQLPSAPAAATGVAADAGTVAGPGPSSLRYQQQEQLLVGSRSWRHAVGGGGGPTLGADRSRWPMRTASQLLASLDEAFRAAAAVTRNGRKRRGGDKAADGSTDKGRNKKGRGSISTSEVATSSHIVGGGGGGGPTGGKGVAAAAAALAAVTAPAAAAAAGMDLSAAAAGGGGGAAAAAAAAGVLGTATTMAAALAAASDARASALRLVSLLMDCWLECTPSQLATAPESEQAAALAMIATACNTLVRRLLLPPPHAGPAGAPPGPPPRPWGSVQDQDQGRQQQQQELALMQQVHDLVARRVAGHFPATLPPVKPPAAVVESLVRLNLQTAELLCCFLPLMRAQQAPPADTAAAAPPPPPPLPWVPALVSYYANVLERGVLVGATHGTLSDAAVTTAATQGLPAGISDAVLAAVSAAVQDLQADPRSARQLMSAVAQFAGRQSPKSAAKLACLRMQHGLLTAALAGRMFLDEAVVVEWLGSLPKLLWEAGGAAPEVTAAALRLLVDAARFAVPGSSVPTHLAASLQPQLGPLFVTQLPPKAVKAALARYAAASPGGSTTSLPPHEAVLVLLPGVVHKLPAAVAALLVDALYHTGPLGGPILKPLAATLSSSLLPLPLAHRLLDVVLARLRHCQDPALAASWILTLLFGPQHGQLVLSPEGADLSPDWDRQRALVVAAARALGGLGGARPLLRVLAAQLAALPLANAASAGARAARLQRYSFLQLAAFARGEPQTGGHGSSSGAAAEYLPEELRAMLPAAAAICGVELGAAAMEQEEAPSSAASASSGAYSPVLQLLSAEPELATPVLRELAGLLPAGGGAVGRLQHHTAALAALRLAMAAVKQAAVRASLAAGTERQAVATAAAALVAAARGLPVAAGGQDVDHAAACVVECQRLTQTVADLYGS